jgi:hypothetical protein
MKIILYISERVAAKRIKGRAFEKQHCASFVAISGMLGAENIFIHT